MHFIMEVGVIGEHKAALTFPMRLPHAIYASDGGLANAI